MYSLKGTRGPLLQSVNIAVQQSLYLNVPVDN